MDQLGASPQQDAVALLEAGYRILAAYDDADKPIPLWRLANARRLEIAPFKDVAIRPLHGEDDRRLAALFNDCFGTTRALEHWAWKYSNNPGKFSTQSVAVLNARPVSHYGGYGLRYTRDGAALKAAHAGDVMSSPEVRGRGLKAGSTIVQTFLHFWLRCCEQADFLYGFNTHVARRIGETYMGFQYANPVPLHTLDRKSCKTEGNHGYEVMHLRHARAECDQLFWDVASHYGLIQVRDAAYLRWRYLRHPEYTYRLWAAYQEDALVGWICVRIDGDGSMLLGDTLIDPRHTDAFPALCQRAFRENPNAGSIKAWFSPSPAWWQEILRDSGWHRGTEPNHLAPAVDMRKPVEWFDDWYYTWGDSDLF